MAAVYVVVFVPVAVLRRSTAAPRATATPFITHTARRPRRVQVRHHTTSHHTTPPRHNTQHVLRVEGRVGVLDVYRSDTTPRHTTTSPHTAHHTTAHQIAAHTHTARARCWRSCRRPRRVQVRYHTTSPHTARARCWRSCRRHRRVQVRHHTTPLHRRHCSRMFTPVMLTRLQDYKCQVQGQGHDPQGQGHEPQSQGHSHMLPQHCQCQTTRNV